MSNSRFELVNKGLKKLDTKLLYISTSKYSPSENDWNSMLHLHNFAELFYVSKGCGKFLLENDKFIVKENDLVIVNPKTLHTETSHNNQDFEYFVLGIDGLSFLFDQDYNDTYIKNYTVNNFSQFKGELTQLLLTLNEEISRQKFGYEIVCQNTLEILLVKIARYSKYNFSIVPSNVSSKECTTIKQYIDTHFKENLTLESLSNLVHMNKYYIAHEFAKSFGISPINYLIEKRIQESKYLLSSTNFSLSQISEITGFSSPSYFSQTFKRVTKQSPKEYRDANYKNTK